MKVIHVVEPFSSGIITFVINLTKALPHHEHHVMHGKRTTEDKIDSVRSRFPEGVEFHVWKHAVRNNHVIKDLLALNELFKHIKANDYDIIHLHSAKAGFLGRLTGMLLGKRNIIYTPNAAPFIRRDVGNFKRKIFRWLEILGSKFSGEVICCGESESRVYYEAGIKNTYINNGVIISENMVSQRHVPDDVIKIGCMGILTPQKAPARFSAIAKAFKDDQGLEFIWVGGGGCSGNRMAK